MKKILSLLVATSLVATSASTVIACESNNNKDTPIAALTLVEGKTAADLFDDFGIFTNKGKLVQDFFNFKAADGEEESGGYKWYTNGSPGEELFYENEKIYAMAKYFTETKDLTIENSETDGHIFMASGKNGDTSVGIYFVALNYVIDEVAKTITATFTTKNEIKLAIPANSTTTVKELTFADGKNVNSIIKNASLEDSIKDGKLTQDYGVTDSIKENGLEKPELPGSNMIANTGILETFNESEGFSSGETMENDGITKLLYDNGVVIYGSKGSNTFDAYLIRIIYIYDTWTKEAIGKGQLVVIAKGTFNIPKTNE